MSPEYENVIDPLIRELLNIVQRADGMTIRDLTVELRNEFDVANKELETDREWKYALYALVAWVDSEIIINHNGWKDETLESHYFKSGNAYTEFFVRAETAYEKRYFNAFEVYYFCFMFGYHGVYQTGDRTVMPRSLPASDAEWQKKASGRLSSIRKREKQDQPDWGETKADDYANMPVSGYQSMIGNAIFLSMVLFICAMVLCVRWFG